MWEERKSNKKEGKYGLFSNSRYFLFVGDHQSSTPTLIVAMDTTTALTLIIPPEFHDQINYVRENNDKAFHRWMPHINFLFPFVPVTEFDGVKQRLAANLAGFGEFQLTLRKASFFPQGKDVTMHLDADDESELQRLYDVVRATLPDVHVKRDDFKPHMTIAQCSREHAEAFVEHLDTIFAQGITFKVTELSLISRSRVKKDEPFSIHSVVALT